MIGGVSGSPVIEDWLGESSGAIGSVGLGWDFDEYWGAETRFSYSSMGLYDSPRAIQSAPYPETDPQRGSPTADRSGEFLIWDVRALYYPWGDTPWRLYGFVGLGVTHLTYDDRLRQGYDTELFTLPFGVGLKYHWTDWMAWRVELADNLALGGNGVETLHHFSYTGGVEIRLGGARKSYWPWNPARNYW